MENILLQALFVYWNNILKKIIILQILFQYVDNIHVKNQICWQQILNIQ